MLLICAVVGCRAVACRPRARAGPSCFLAWAYRRWAIVAAGGRHGGRTVSAVARGCRAVVSSPGTGD